MITSIQNTRIKEWRKLQMKKQRQKMKAFFIEGYHLIEEACKSDWNIMTLIIQEGVFVPPWMEKYEKTYVTKNVFSHLSQTEAPQGVAAIVQMKETNTFSDGLILLIDAVQDPGNVGTMIRTAEAAGFQAVILGDGTVDLFNDKVIRATQGALFHIPIMQENLQQMVKTLKEKEYVVVASALERAVSFDQMKKEKKMALIVGNEGSGIKEELLLQADEIVKIPIYGKADSLNVTVAAGILMYAMRN